MFNRSRRNPTCWFTLSMGSILILFAGVLFYQRSIAHLEESDRLLYRKTRILLSCLCPFLCFSLYGLINHRFLPDVPPQQPINQFFL
jgi:hypothetical protein